MLQGELEMKIVKMVKFERADSCVLQKVTELCGMAASFFSDDRLSPDHDEHGLRAVMRLQAGHPLEEKHMDEAVEQVKRALGRLRATEPHSFFPAELKVSYEANLTKVLTVLETWKRMLTEDSLHALYPEL